MIVDRFQTTGGRNTYGDNPSSPAAATLFVRQASLPVDFAKLDLQPVVSLPGQRNLRAEVELQRGRNVRVVVIDHQLQRALTKGGRDGAVS